jgi:hypothetical protein
MTRLWLSLAALALASAAHADDPPPSTPPAGAELDGVDNIRLLDTHFARYGYEPLKRIHRQDGWIRVRLPGSTKEVTVPQTGLYSYVALAGDFEIEATVGFHEVPAPKGGYGMSAGFAVDTHGPDGMVALFRNYSQHKGGSGYCVMHGKEVDGSMNYKVLENWPTNAKACRLQMRREKDELICSVREGRNDWLEIGRVTYTKGTVRQIRLYGDTGGSETSLDVWVGALRVKAEEITGGFPKRDIQPGWGWQHALLGMCIFTACAWLLSRWQQGKWPWRERGFEAPRKVRRPVKVKK